MSKIKAPTIFYIKLDCFKYDIKVNFSDDINSQRKNETLLLEDWKNEDKHAEALHSYNDKHPYTSFLFFSFKVSIPVIVHEISHVVDNLFNWIGEKYPGTETRAYLNEYILKQILDQR